MTYTRSRKKKRITKGRNQKSQGLHQDKTLSPSLTSTTPVSYLKQRCCNLPCRQFTHLLTPQSLITIPIHQATPEAASLRPGAQPPRNNRPSGHAAPSAGRAGQHRNASSSFPLVQRAPAEHRCSPAQPVSCLKCSQQPPPQGPNQYLSKEDLKLV